MPNPLYHDKGPKPSAAKGIPREKIKEAHLGSLEFGICIFSLLHLSRSEENPNYLCK